MTFPLPQGLCRRVCRPVRVPPRLSGWKEAVRFARAAVRHGDDPCFVASQVAIAVGCDICGCGEELEAVIKASDNAGLKWADVLIGLYGLVEALSGIRLGGGQLPDPGTWWDRFLRFLRRVIRPAEIIGALWELVSAVDAFEAAFYDLQRAIDALQKCKEGKTI